MRLDPVIFSVDSYFANLSHFKYMGQLCIQQYPKLFWYKYVFLFCTVHLCKTMRFFPEIKLLIFLAALSFYFSSVRVNLYFSQLRFPGKPSYYLKLLRVALSRFQRGMIPKGRLGLIFKNQFPNYISTI